jgi:tripartite-type tricarboxylate transporter receptor subunit TctC
MKKILTLFCFFVFSHIAIANTVTVLIPFSPGGPTDTLWRSIEPLLNEKLKQHNIKLITENLPGAGGTIASNRIAATEDRLILGFFSPALVVAPNTVSDVVRYNATSFRLIGYAGSTDMVVVSSMSVDQFNEKCRNSVVFFGSSGNGSTGHLLGSIVANGINCKEIIHVPYKGISAAYLDLLAGRIDYLVDFSINADSQIKSGSVNKLFSMNEKFPNSLENWHVLISNNYNSPLFSIIQKEFSELKNDKNFVNNLEFKLKIKNFSIIKNQNWLTKEFENYKNFIESIK